MTNGYNPGSRFKLGSPYGERIDPITAEAGKFHSGVDYRAPAGTPIPTAASGVVVYSGFNKNLGNTVIVRNDTGEYSLYGHMLDGHQVGLGQRIWPGDVVGLVGSTGDRATGPHLHYSVITKDAGKRITANSIDGSIGFHLSKTTTLDPVQDDNYDSAPRYLDATRRAAQMMSGTAANSFPAVPRSDPQASLDDRFGNSGFVPAGNGPPLAPDHQDAFADRFGSWISDPASTTAPRGPQAAPPAQASRPLGIFSGEPMPRYPVPPPIWGLPDQSRPSGDDDENWYTRWRRRIGP